VSDQQPVEAQVAAGVRKPIVHRIRMEAVIACPCNPLRPLFCNSSGTYGETVCPDCGKAYRMTFLHFDEHDALAPRDANGQPSASMDFEVRQTVIEPKRPAIAIARGTSKPS
jgi:hypothetical protein